MVQVPEAPGPGTGYFDICRDALRCFSRCRRSISRCAVPTLLKFDIPIPTEPRHYDSAPMRPDRGINAAHRGRAISRSLSVTVATLSSHELESPHPVAADPFCGFLDGVRVLEAE